jgi:DNA-binding CsgD family transcriptional regulator
MVGLTAVRSPQDLLDLIEAHRPDVVLAAMTRDGLPPELPSDIRVRWPELRLLLLDLGALIEQSGAHGSSSGPDKTPAAPIRSRTSGPQLTERERVVLAAVAAGLTTSEISRDLFVSEHTVKFHLTKIYRKLGVSNRAGAVRYAVEHDLVNA